LARRYAAFTTLLCFDVLRTALLFTLFGHVDREAYAMTYDALALTDLVLQFIVAFSMFRIGARPFNMPQRLRLFALLAACSAALSWGLSNVIRSDPRSLLDRGVIFSGLLTVGVGFVSNWRLFDRAAHVLMAGLVAVGAFAVSTQIGKTVAAYNRDAVVYRRWSYADAGVYLVVLLIWVVLLATARRERMHLTEIVVR